MVYLTTLPVLDQRITAGVLFRRPGAMAFAHIYLLDRAERWWAIIPGGFMLMLGGTIALSSLTEEPAVLGTVLFIGLGAVFFLLYLLGQRWQLWWALVPGSVLVLLGLFLFSVGLGQQNLPLRLWPVLLPCAGRVVDMAGDASDAQPQAECRCRAQSVPFARSVLRKPAAPAQAGVNTAGLLSGAAVEVLPDPEESQ